jgi:hypothetical protein
VRASSSDAPPQSHLFEIERELNLGEDTCILYVLYRETDSWCAHTDARMHACTLTV